MSASKPKARDFRRKLPSKGVKGSVKRHILGCGTVASAAGSVPGPKPSETKKSAIAKAISGSDNVHKQGGRKKNREDYKVDSKLIKARKERKTAAVAKRDIPHLQAAADVAYSHRKEFGKGIYNQLGKIYGTARTSDGKSAIRFKSW